MTTSYTANAKIAMPGFGDTGWSTPINSNASLLDSLNPIGDLCVTTKEVPSTTLNVAVASGVVIAQDGSTVIYAGTTSFTNSASSTAVLFLDGTASWALTSAASFPATPHVKLATVVTGGSAVTSIVDARQAYNVSGTIADGVNWTFGTTTGTQIGTATSGKIGFFGKTPIVQPTIGTGTAGATYTSAEQSMLQSVHDAVRALGLGS